MLAFGLAIALGGYLVAIGGWPILVAGLASIAAGIAYTRGPRPIAYTGLGEAFVFAFFGLVAVCGSHFLQAGSVGRSAVGAGAMIGGSVNEIVCARAYRGCSACAMARHAAGMAECRRRYPLPFAFSSIRRSNLPTFTTTRSWVPARGRARQSGPGALAQSTILCPVLNSRKARGRLRRSNCGMMIPPPVFCAS